MMLLQVGFIFALVILPKVRSECGVCGSLSNVACISETKFSFCFDGTPDPSKTSECPNNTICTNTAQICGNPGGTPECISECGKCGADKKFACLNENTLALCLGTDTPSTITQSCPAGKVCKNSAPNFCVDPATEKSSCAAGEQAPTPKPPTTPRPSSPTEFCRKKNRPGRYPAEGDANCQSYCYCYILEQRLVGRVYPCPPKTIFHATKELCVSPETYTCPPQSSTN